MSQWMSEHGYLIIVFIVVCIAAAFIFIKAVQSYSNHNKTFKAQEAELKRLKALKDKYRNITADQLENCDKEEILEGIALVYQVELQKSDDMEKAFSEMTIEKQYIYTLDVFVGDASAGEFFSQNGQILTGIILDALNNIGMDDFSKKLSQISKMYDKDDESISYSEKAIEDFDKFMEQENILRKIKLNAAKYIIENINILQS